MNIALKVPLILLFLVPFSFLGWFYLKAGGVITGFMKDEAQTLTKAGRRAYWGFAVGFVAVIAIGGLVGFAITPPGGDVLTYSTVGDLIGLGIALVASIPLSLYVRSQRANS